MKGTRAVLIAALVMTAAPAGASALSRMVVAGVHRTNQLPVGLAARGHGVIRLGASPGNPIANPKTHTLYVALQCGNPNTNASCAHTAGHALDVINANTCKPHSPHGCRPVSRAAAGKAPLAEAIDFKTDTIYVGDATGTVTVIDGADCNASATRGCRKPLATIKTGGLIIALAFNPRTRTVYAASLASHGGVFVIDAAACNAHTTKGCKAPVKKVKDPLIPDGIAIDSASDTVYAANTGPNGNGHTVSVINGATCNGHHSSGCGGMPRTINVGQNPFWDVVDPATQTLYVANYDDGTVSVIDADKCNAKTASGCHRVRAVQTGAGAAFLAIDQKRHTLFAINQDDGTLSTINTNACNGTVTSGCRKRARSEHATFNTPYGYNPNAFALSPKTGTAYLVNVGGQPFMGAVSINHCNATDTSGCRVEAPAVRDHLFLLSIDHATNTIYAGDSQRPRIDVIDGATCTHSRRSGCKPIAHIPMPHPDSNVGAIDDATHTLYAPDSAGHTIAVINIAHCTVGDTSGCASASPKIKVGQFPGQPVLNRATHTLYVPNAPPGNRVAVINAATCNATNTSGCGQIPAQVPVAKGSFIIALSAAKNTVYAAGSGFGASHLLRTVAVINGATCNGTRHSGCAHPAATVKVGLAPYGLAVDDHTHTVYVADNGNGDVPGTVSLINSDTCNGSHTAGCAGRKPTAPTGRSPLGVAIDSSTDTVYIADFSSAAVTVLDGEKCRVGRTGGCARAVHSQPVGSLPVQPAVNPATHSVFEPDQLTPGALSIFKTSP